MSKNLPAAVLIAGTLAVLLLTAGAQFILFGGEDLAMKPLEILPDSEVPREILIWLDKDKYSEGYGAFFREGDLFLAVRMGERPTGGYAVFLGNPRLEKAEAVVTAEFRRPKPWDMVTQVLTYPRTVVRIASAGRCPASALFLAVDGSVLARVEVVFLDQE
ncbi:MAG TPA: hypothetical protein DG577_08710 [Firmicutes bacterium]|jgi:hypothetical protein|nr:hypothetical protein [Bacillota bacterium]HBS92753.1 hypothetical protein [Bacillota bacterium]HCX79481.1 hypothetical protein [Bacillota bacterium]